MQYLLLIYVPNGERRTEAEIDQEIGEYWAYEKEVSEAGVMVDSKALKGVDAATTIAVRGDERIVTDGPFTETSEVLGGYYLLDVPDLDTALDWAARIPGARRGKVEVRPIQVFEQP
ncbi:YciI family protein [Pseudonocardia acaciae]|uniref:YciI family protein n=1 Tax=Pseudonocardia acaciae TaxID=551276 RepID=UPI00048E608B|nr:YciI family protein [Pseudonocardia acaciae]